MNEIKALKDHFKTENVVREENYDTYGLKAYRVDSGVYIVGDYDTAVEAAVKDSKSVFEDCFDDDEKAEWLQKWGWPGVDEEGVCSVLISEFGEEYEDLNSYSIDSILDTLGMSLTDTISWDFLKNYVDAEAVGRFIVDSDGVANSLATYDGREVCLGNDFYAFRVD